MNSKTGAIQSMNIDNDKQNMNWLIATDGSQYPWIKENYGWGLGYFTRETHYTFSFIFYTFILHEYRLFILLIRYLSFIYNII